MLKYENKTLTTSLKISIPHKNLRIPTGSRNSDFRKTLKCAENRGNADRKGVWSERKAEEMD